MPFPKHLEQNSSPKPENIFTLISSNVFSFTTKGPKSYNDVKTLPWDFPGGLVVKTALPLHVGVGLTPCQRTKISQAKQCGQKKKKKKKKDFSQITELNI